ncbi:MAG: Rpp14/Pop5 family protein [Candidatus Aenigmatarchaeota archaeon]
MNMPTLREKERYIAFQAISEDSVMYSDLESAIWDSMMDFFGELGTAKTSMWIVKNLYDEQNQMGVIKCNNKSVQEVITGLGLISRLGDARVTIKILSVSGTIRGLKS